MSQTTERPHRRRRRFPWLASALIFVGITTIFSTVYNEHQRREQASSFRLCIAQQFDKLGKYNESRAALNQQDTDATVKVILSVGAAKDVTSIETALEQFKTDQQAISLQRKTLKPPPFPTGKCE